MALSYISPKVWVILPSLSPLSPSPYRHPFSTLPKPQYYTRYFNPSPATDTGQMPLHHPLSGLVDPAGAHVVFFL